MQDVSVLDQTSRLLPVTSGVPQGSVLGPVLFLFYINDIFDMAISANLKLYADDALLYTTVSPENNILFQKDLDGLSLWAESSAMSFNVTKCQSIFFGAKPLVALPQHRLNGQLLKRVNSLCYLGVTISDDLAWDRHVDGIVSKANRSLGLLKRSLYKAPKYAKLTAYKTICRPLLEFACEVWDPSSQKNISNIEMVQHRAIRFILNLRGICSITEARAELNLDTLEERRRGSRKNLFLRIMAGDNEHPALAQCFPELCFNAHGEVGVFCNTRAATNRDPIAIQCRSTALLNSFIPRTSRELRATTTHTA